MTSLLNGEITYPRYPHGNPLNRTIDVKNDRKGFMTSTPTSSLLIDKEFFIEDVEDHR